jgi:hypothetical protein
MKESFHESVGAEFIGNVLDFELKLKTYLEICEVYASNSFLLIYEYE